MAGPKPRTRLFASLAAAALAAGTLVLAGGSAAEAVPGVTCPTVGSGGVVTPAPTAGVDWDHCDLRDADLAGADLAGANLAYAIMSGANLTGANLTGTNLYATIFNSANLSSADFTGATMTLVYSGLITASPAPTLPTGWLLVNGYLAGPGADLDSAALSGADLASADLDGAQLGGANLTGADLNDANLTGAALADVESGGITGATTLLPADWQLKSGYLAGPDTDLSGDDAAGADLSGTDLEDADLYGTNLSGADLSDTNLTGVDGAGVDLENASLTDANLTDASIALDAFGAGAPTLQGADLAGATLTGVITAVIAGGPAVLPAHWTFADGYLLGPTANLKYGEYLEYTDLSGVDLDFANIASTEFYYDDLANASFWGSNATAANFYEDTWSNTICPNAISSDYYISGCFSARRYEMSTIATPRPGSTLSKSRRHFTAEFRLANPGVGQLTGATAEALAAGHDVKAILAGPGIKTQTVSCGWNTGASYFSCTFTTPPRAETGKSHDYTVTIRVNQGPGFLNAMPISGVPNPETIHFG